MRAGHIRTAGSAAALRTSSQSDRLKWIRNIPATSNRKIRQRALLGIGGSEAGVAPKTSVGAGLSIVKSFTAEMAAPKGGN
jgi:hypothetical protein